MLICGLTGGIGCGKSTVSTELRDAGLAVIDLDKLGHEVLDWHSVRRAVQTRLGNEVMDEDGRIDRKQLSALVFSSPVQRRMLNGIIHPRMLLALVMKLLCHFCVGTPVVVLDAPLLFETGLHRMCTLTVAVTTPPDVQLQRLMARDGMGEDDAQLRLSAQMSAAAKAARADKVLDNTSDRVALQALVRAELLPWLRRPMLLPWRVCSLPGLTALLLALLAAVRSKL